MARLIALADLDEHPLLGPLLALDEDPGDEDAAEDLAAAAFSSTRPIVDMVAWAVLGWSTRLRELARDRDLTGDARLDRAAAELDLVGRLAHADHRALLAPFGLADAVGSTSSPPPADVPPAARAMHARLLVASTWGELVDELVRLYRAEGPSALTVRRVVRWDRDAGTALPVERPDPVTLGDLVGGEDLRQELLDDLDLLTSGVRPNDALLYGPPGTGKSAAVRACAGAFAERGVRLVEVARDDVDQLPLVLDQLAGEGPPCVLFLDDLVFDDGMRGDRELRAVLEGSTSGRPDNVVVWATSNRLRLLGDSMATRADDADPEEAAGERAALAQRFGRRLRFGRQGRDAYLAIARRLVADRFGAAGPEVDDAAMRFAVQGHGLSARTAHQFALAWRPGA